MLDVVYGPFPRLEAAFLSALRELKSGAPLAPALVVAPSRRLADRLQRLAALEAGLALIGVEFTTFHGLAVEIACAEGPAAKPVLGDALFFDKLVDRILRAQGAGGRFRGLSSALRSSIKDLSDAGVDGAAMLGFVREKLFGADEALERLAKLYAAYERAVGELDVVPPAALVQRAADAASASPYLKGFQRVLYYGFYDLTGAQLDLFHAVSKNHPTTVFFPYRRKSAAYSFASRFFESQLHGGKAPVSAPGPDAPKAAVAAFTAAGHHDELWKAAKGILRLVEDEGYAYSEIGVVARTLDPYRPFLAQVFGDHSIPFHTSAEEPLLRYPIAKQCLALATWARRDYPAVSMLDLLGSPAFKRRRSAWRRLVERLRIHQGWLQWEGKLERWAVEGDPDVTPREEAASLLALLRGLRAELAPGAAPETWSERTARLKRLLDEHLEFEPGEVSDAVRAAVDRLAAFDRLGEPPTQEEFLDALEESFRRSSLPLSPRANQGVSVLDAMSARGESFRAVFALGLKEKLFPRVVREDPFLRDRHRASLRDAAGHWISTKLGGFDEERLLFELVVESARERLVVSWPRSNEDGRAESPSIYALELLRSRGAAPESVPLRPLPRLESEASRLTPKEASVALALAGADAGALYEKLEWPREPYARSRRCAEALASLAGPGAYDGVVGPSAAVERRFEDGLSPTAVQTYATCPFKFFASWVLQIREPDEAQERKSVPADVRGRIYHRFLETFYKDLDGLPKTLPKAAFDRTAKTVFAEYGWRSLGVYPLLWRSLEREMLRHLEAFLTADLAALAAAGRRPAHFELELDGAIEGIPAHGRADRIDVGPDGFHVVDYKTSLPKGKGALLKQLARSRALQLAFYLELGKSVVKLDAAGAELCGLETADRAALSKGEWLQIRDTVFKNVGLFVGWAREGRFFLYPSDDRGHCNWCAYASVCRRSHGPSVARARRAHGPFDAATGGA